MITVHDLTTGPVPRVVRPATLAYSALIRRAVAAGLGAHPARPPWRAEVVEALGVDPERVRARAVGDAGPGRRADRARPGRPPAPAAGDRAVVLAMGTAEPRKDLPGLVRAFEAGRPPNTRRWPAGPGGARGLGARWPSRGRSRRSPSPARIRPRTGWLDGRPDAHALLRAGRCWPTPPATRGSGSPPPGRGRAGVPGGGHHGPAALPEVLGEAAELVDVGDAEALAAALARVIGSEGPPGAALRDPGHRPLRPGTPGTVAPRAWRRCTPTRPASGPGGEGEPVCCWRPSSCPAGGCPGDSPLLPRGLLQGLAEAGAPDTLPVSLVLLASRPPRGGSAPEAGATPRPDLGWPVRCSRLPSRLLTRLPGTWAWRPAPTGFDVVHAVLLAAPPVRRSVARTAGGTGHAAPALVVTIHDLAWRRNPEATTRHGRRWHEGASARALRRADAAGGGLRRPGAGRPAGRRSGPGRGVPVDPQRGPTTCRHPTSLRRRTLLRRDEGLGADLLTVGTREPRKNLSRVLAACIGIARRSLPAPWPLVGGGAAGLGGRRRRRPRTGPVPTGWWVLGPVPDATLAGLYARACLLVYAPLSEGYGLPPLEAMRFGVPRGDEHHGAERRPHCGRAAEHAEQAGPAAAGAPARRRCHRRRPGGGLDRRRRGCRWPGAGRPTWPERRTWRRSASQHAALGRAMAVTDPLAAVRVVPRRERGVPASLPAPVATRDRAGGSGSGAGSDVDGLRW